MKPRKSRRSKLTGSLDFDNTAGDEIKKVVLSKRVLLKFSKEDTFRRGTRVKDMHKIFETRFESQIASEKKFENDYNTHNYISKHSNKTDNILINGANGAYGAYGAYGGTGPSSPIIQRYGSNGKSERILKMAQRLESQLYKTEPLKAANSAEIFLENTNTDNILKITMEKPIVKKNKISKSSLKLLF
jgi:hypothetical protein